MHPSLCLNAWVSRSFPPITTRNRRANIFLHVFTKWLNREIIRGATRACLFSSLAPQNLDVVFRAKYFSRPNICPCLVFSELLFPSVAAKKKEKEKGKKSTIPPAPTHTRRFQRKRRAQAASLRRQPPANAHSPSHQIRVLCPFCSGLSLGTSRPGLSRPTRANGTPPPSLSSAQHPPLCPVHDTLPAKLRRRRQGQ